MSSFASRHRRRLPHTPSEIALKLHNRPPPPSHRHSGPSAPWPWINLTDEVDFVQLGTELPPIPDFCDHSDCEGRCWKDYPASRFPNWTPSQVAKSRIVNVYIVDVNVRGLFLKADTETIREENKQAFWEYIIRNHRPPTTRVRALFVENMSGPVLQMLGAKYNIEPFFFSSSISWIPSRFQEEVRPGKGDRTSVSPCYNHLDFLKACGDDAMSVPNIEASDSSFESSPGGNTLISYHTNTTDEATPAKYLEERIRFAGQSVYWQNILQRSSDPTFLLLIFIWHAMYAWDEALETLYAYICSLETRVMSPSNIDLTRELHLIRAHLLHYASLLGDMKKSVQFVRDTPNPAMAALSEEEKELSHGLLQKECTNLISDIDRLEQSRQMQDKRLKNVMNLVFSSVNIVDSRRMQELTEAAMKQIAYLTMFFLPASFVAAVFGMNVGEISPGTHGTLPYYFETAAPLTVATIWIIMAFQSKYLFGNRRTTFWTRLGWPWLLFKRMFWNKEAREEDLRRSDHYELPKRASAARAP
ncbi:hypothetical protein BDZ89DRAFT_1057791, partial [Hymenopellis radicata]